MYSRLRAAWWRNLQAHPAATVDLADGQRPITARAAEGEERARLWRRWQQIDANLDAYAALRSSQTAVDVLEPRPTPGRRPPGNARAASPDSSTRPSR